ncbi:hypothetical protein EZV62_026457 [Acer yangbiense]|uniref:Uncharacterized protein n=1 Tax=Acer yangbiense TaxID=1000413 RepID=A0A5C7GRE0_9ROSI|nr:hypothetical protein EZV62_026457 [Acer yangbiense]
MNENRRKKEKQLGRSHGFELMTLVFPNVHTAEDFNMEYFLYHINDLLKTAMLVRKLKENFASLIYSYSKPVEVEILLLILLVMLAAEVLVKVALALVHSLQGHCRNDQSRLLHLLVRYFVKRPVHHQLQRNPETSQSHSHHALQRQLRQHFRQHDSGLDQALMDALPALSTTKTSWA